MADEPISYYERRLQREIEQIDVRIRELTQEKSALQRQLLKARQEASGLSEVSRRNSVMRIMIENRVLDALRSANKPLSSYELFQNARYANFELKENTFRTYLHRLKQRGLIASAGQPGRWRAIAPQPSPTSKATDIFS
ncbi:hypothetical protein MWN34_10755 [Ancylobacter sp. 6x-1]|uniref:DNA-binding protein n=1 Tax=Ancylobacter crimeensis TaxID=2579147 RepID=A0ABT0DBQ5_9HYPH|nr:hypothetical protein [Ancylobacter crimeensis]MCK0197392.1 hypothetical protein [Ancylobacter crimeensis]